MVSEGIRILFYFALVAVARFSGKFAAEQTIADRPGIQLRRIGVALGTAWLPALFIAAITPHQPRIGLTRAGAFIGIAVVTALGSPVKPYRAAE